MRKIVSVALLSTILAAPAAAQAPTEQQSATAGQPAKDPNRIICEREEVIGSRLGGQRICKTAQQWEQARQQSRSDVDDLQRFTANPKPHG